MRKVIFAIVSAALVLIIVWQSYFRNAHVNPLTGKKQYIDLTVNQEVQLGLQCAPQLASEYGGLFQDRGMQNKVKKIGNKLLKATEADVSGYQFDFHVLADSLTLNAFALPGGQVFVTAGFIQKLKTEDEIAAVLSHEIGHVLGRHAAEQLDGNYLIEILSGSKKEKSLQSETDKYVANFLKLDFREADERESDLLAVKYMTGSGYKVEALLRIIDLTDKSLKTHAFAEYVHRHPVTGNRTENIREAIQKYKVDQAVKK